MSVCSGTRAQPGMGSGAAGAHVYSWMRAPEGNVPRSLRAWGPLASRQGLSAEIQSSVLEVHNRRGTSGKEGLHPLLSVRGTAGARDSCHSSSGLLKCGEQVKKQAEYFQLFWFLFPENLPLIRNFWRHSCMCPLVTAWFEECGEEILLRK